MTDQGYVISLLLSVLSTIIAILTFWLADSREHRQARRTLGSLFFLMAIGLGIWGMSGATGLSPRYLPTLTSETVFPAHSPYPQPLTPVESEKVDSIKDAETFKVTQQPTANPSSFFEPVQFCGESDWDDIRKDCRSRRREFSDPTQRIYATFAYHNLSVGMRIKRAYYYNGEHQWETVNTVGENDRWSTAGETGTFWILIDAQEGSAAQAFGSNYLPRGEYSIILFLDNEVQQTASFSITD